MNACCSLGDVTIVYTQSQTTYSKITLLDFTDQAKPIYLLVDKLRSVFRSFLSFVIRQDWSQNAWYKHSKSKQGIYFYIENCSNVVAEAPPLGLCK